jgi:hypothetical protein
VTKREIANLSFKVLSLYAVIKAIDKLSSLISYMYQYSHTDLGVLDYMIFTAPVILLLLCGGILWFIAPLLASSISKSTVSEDNSNASLLSIQMVAFSVIGLYMLVDSLPALVQATIWYFIVTGKRYQFAVDIIGSLVKIGLSLWLLFGSRGLINFINSMRRD